MSLIKIFFTVSLLLTFFNLRVSEVLLNPISEGEEIGLVILSGAQISAEGYRSLGRTIQEKIKTKKIWVSVPDVFGNLPLSFLAGKAIKKGISNLYSAGMDKNAKIYLAGHSLGGVAIGKFAEQSTANISGLILLGSFLDRSLRGKDLKTRVVQIGGELDGLSRITRFAEEFYHRSYDKETRKYVSNGSNDSPVFVIKGMNHMQFASGDIPYLVNLRDLKSEIDELSAHNEIANLINAFILNDLESLDRAFKSTLELLHPIIQAYEMEGSIHFNRPGQKNCIKGACGEGSHWAAIAQGILGGKNIFDKEGLNLTITNTFVILSSLPPLNEIHHPKLIVDPSDSKNVTIHTMSECSWDTLDKWVDSAFAPTSASEIGSKFISRQCTLRKGANLTVDETPFTLDTDFDWCREINIAAYNWTLSKVSHATLKRYEVFGQKMVFNKDYVVKNGFSFTYGLLKMEENKSGDLEVTSRTMMTPEDYPPIPIFAPEGSGCYHYCKNISPARIIEWIYVDGLRKNYGISSN
jgi:hypothetical protein